MMAEEEDNSSTGSKETTTGPPVLVTGATGFLGSHLCEALESSGYEVHAISRKPSVAPNHHVCDLTDAQTLPTILQARDWHAVFHLAGLVSYKPSEASAMQSVNVHATRDLLSDMLAHAPRAKLIYCSSVAAVGSNTSPRAPELDESAPWDDSLSGIAYARTKRDAEDLVRAAGQSGKLSTVALCPSNIFGPRDGRKESRAPHVRAANGRATLYTQGGVSIVHVRVVVAAFMAVLKAPVEDSIWKGSRWLLTGDNISVRHMLTLCAGAGGNARFAPWLCLPNWLLAVFCIVASCFGSSKLTWDRFVLATRYHWFDGSAARRRFQLSTVSAREAIHDSVNWMREEGLVEPRAS